MPQDFPLRPRLQSRETLPSFLSRFALMRRMPLVVFAQDLGAPLKRIFDSDRAAAVAVASWGGLASVDVDEMLSWTGVPVGDVRMTFRGETFVSRALRSPTLRGCPICLREDAEAHEGDLAEAMAYRGHWQFRESFICVKHGRCLVPLWSRTAEYERYDFSTRFKEIQGDLLGGKLDPGKLEETGFELWLDRRLQTGEDPFWTKSEGLYPTSIFCRFLGEALLARAGRQVTHDVAQARAAQDVAFEVVCHGTNAIAETLDRLATTSPGKSSEPKAAFGALYGKLRRDTVADPTFATFRGLLRDCILRNFPIAACEDFFGEPLPERRIHSLYTAAQEAGVTEALLRPFLVERGALPAEDTRPPNRQIFDAQIFAPLLAEVPKLSSINALKDLLNATKTEIAALSEAGFLVPRAKSDVVRLKWNLDEARDLLDSLTSRAETIADDAPGWETLLAARIRTGKSVRDLVVGAQADKVRLGQGSDAGFRGLRLLSTDVDALDVPHTVTLPEDLVPATEFGRSIGIRDGGRFRAFIEAGHTPATWARHPTSGVRFLYVSAKDIEAFHQRFVTIPILALERGLPIPKVRAALKAARVQPFSPQGQDYGRIFLSSEAETAFGRRN
ncbi:TniQ family protein [Stagnihabitans tardus]|uniref:TniQ domain-containing protein n=1 Tax=Stagnihabitans tardus TaxID=2699202 RepID=A0AAE4Y858_9RHOB|nr:TniQ family protein [Stagnihabitans tardus]NBZ87628.1 hypothetical protein [Stagnihabitans tardus]